MVVVMIVMIFGVDKSVVVDVDLAVYTASRYMTSQVSLSIHIGSSLMVYNINIDLNLNLNSHHAQQVTFN